MKTLLSLCVIILFCHAGCTSPVSISGERVSTNEFKVTIHNISDKPIKIFYDREQLQIIFAAYARIDGSSKEVIALATSDPNWDSGYVTSQKVLKPNEKLEYRIILGETYQVHYESPTIYKLGEYSEERLRKTLANLESVLYSVWYVDPAGKEVNVKIEVGVNESV